MACGIYKLKFTGTPKVYIGQAINIQYRFKEHLRRLLKGDASIKMQQAYRMYGEPILEVIEEIPQEALNSKELGYITQYNSILEGFNTLMVGSLEGALYIHNTSNSLYDKEVYFTILDMLVSTFLTTKEISEQLGVSVYIVRQIAALTSHKWLKVDHPEAYAKLEEMASIGRNSLSHSINRHTFLMSPEDKEYEVLNISKFAEEHNLAYGSVYSLLRGNIPHFKGWYIKGTTKIIYEEKSDYPNIVSPDGKIYSIPSRGISTFAREHNLNNSGLRRLLLKSTNNYKGWTLCL